MTTIETSIPVAVEDFIYEDSGTLATPESEVSDSPADTPLGPLSVKPDPDPDLIETAETDSDSSGVSEDAGSVDFIPRGSEVCGLSVSSQSRPVIQCVVGELHLVFEQMQRALQQTGRYYVSGSRIVVVRKDDLLKRVCMEEATAAEIRHDLSKAVDWKVPGPGEDGWRKANVPLSYCRELLQLKKFPGLDSLHGIAQQPFFRTDGTLCREAGYDGESKIYGCFDPVQFHIPAEPTLKDARAATKRLGELMLEFAFVELKADFAATLAAVLTAAIRPSLAAAPMFVVAAPAAGTGKTLLCELISAFAGPGRAMPMAFPGSAVECEKVLHSELRTGPSVIFFDNIGGDIPAHDKLCSVLTSEFSSGRTLGSSVTARYSTKSLFLATGNNTRPSRDMARRCVTIRLDARDEMPAARKFKRPNLLQEVLEQREALVSDALTIVAARLAAGAACVSEPKPLGSFADWSRWCRESVIWLGLKDPAESAFASMQDDDERQLLCALFKAWHGYFGNAVTSVSELIERAEGETEDGGLRDVLLEISDEARGFNRRRIGRWLLRHENTRAAGLKLNRANRGGHSASWKVVGTAVA